MQGRLRVVICAVVSLINLMEMSVTSSRDFHADKNSSPGNMSETYHGLSSSEIKSSASHSYFYYTAGSRSVGTDSAKELLHPHPDGDWDGTTGGAGWNNWYDNSKPQWVHTHSVSYGYELGTRPAEGYTLYESPRSHENPVLYESPGGELPIPPPTTVIVGQYYDRAPTHPHHEAPFPIYDLPKVAPLPVPIRSLEQLPPPSYGPPTTTDHYITTDVPPIYLTHPPPVYGVPSTTTTTTPAPTTVTTTSTPSTTTSTTTTTPRTTTTTTTTTPRTTTTTTTTTTPRTTTTTTTTTPRTTTTTTTTTPRTTTTTTTTTPRTTTTSTTTTPRTTTTTTTTPSTTTTTTTPSTTTTTTTTTPRTTTTTTTPSTTTTTTPVPTTTTTHPTTTTHRPAYTVPAWVTTSPPYVHTTPSVGGYHNRPPTATSAPIYITSSSPAIMGYAEHPHPSPHPTVPSLYEVPPSVHLSSTPGQYNNPYPTQGYASPTLSTSYSDKHSPLQGATPDPSFYSPPVSTYAPSPPVQHRVTPVTSRQTLWTTPPAVTIPAYQQMTTYSWYAPTPTSWAPPITSTQTSYNAPRPTVPPAVPLPAVQSTQVYWAQAPPTYETRPAPSTLPLMSSTPTPHKSHYDVPVAQYSAPTTAGSLYGVPGQAPGEPLGHYEPERRVSDHQSHGGSRVQPHPQQKHGSHTPDRSSSVPLHFVPPGSSGTPGRGQDDYDEEDESSEESSIWDLLGLGR